MQTPPTIRPVDASGNAAAASPASNPFISALAMAIIAALGLLCVVAPVLMRREPLMPAPLFPVVRTGVEQIGWDAFVGLALLGLCAGLITRLWPPLIALASIAALPVAMFAEIIADSTSHNLFPIELAMYLMLAVPVLLAALVGRWLRGRLQTK